MGFKITDEELQAGLQFSDASHWVPMAEAFKVPMLRTFVVKDGEQAFASLASGQRGASQPVVNGLVEASNHTGFPLMLTPGLLPDPISPKACQIVRNRADLPGAALAIARISVAYGLPLTSFCLRRLSWQGSALGTIDGYPIVPTHRYFVQRQFEEGLPPVKLIHDQPHFKLSDFVGANLISALKINELDTALRAHFTAHVKSGVEISAKALIAVNSYHEWAVDVMLGPEGPVVWNMCLGCLSRRYRPEVSLEPPATSWVR